MYYSTNMLSNGSNLKSSSVVSIFIRHFKSKYWTSIILFWWYHIIVFCLCITPVSVKLFSEEKFEDIKGYVDVVMQGRTYDTMAAGKRTKRQTMDNNNKKLHRKLKFEHHKLHLRPEVTSCVPDRVGLMIIV